MNSADYVDKLIKDSIAAGKPLSDTAWEAALACVGWAYVYGARGQYCTPANRRARYSDEHPTIKTACKNFDGSGSCKGCKWYPQEKRTRFFDCRGFTYWILKQVYGWELIGAGATSQWNKESNWKAKGLVSEGIPQGVIVCLFYHKKGSSTVMAHTGLYYNGETCECSNGVQHFTELNEKWTHWAVPACVDGAIPDPVKPEPKPGDDMPTLRIGSKGDAVKDLQFRLHWKGYDLGSCGVDGDFGKATQAAVKAFQTDSGLQADGVCGRETWRALLGDSNPEKRYTVRISGVSETVRNRLLKEYPDAIAIEEGV